MQFIKSPAVFLLHLFIIWSSAFNSICIFNSCYVIWWVIYLFQETLALLWQELKPCCSFFYCGAGSAVYAQVFYEVRWKSDNVTYSGLLIYYNTDDALMRVHYTTNGQYKVAEFKCQYKKLNLSGSEGYLLDGIDAKIVYGNDGTSTYSSDNFYFYKQTNGYGKPYTVDDGHLAKENPSQYMQQVESWEKIPTSKFTEQFVRNFFEKTEPLYGKLLAYNVQTNSALAGGFRISSAAHNGEKWFVCMSKGTSYTDQATYHEAAFPTEWIRKKWDDGKEITSVSYGEGQWLVVMSGNSKITTQSYKSTAEYPADWIKEKWADGFRMSSVAYGDGEWFVVMSKGTGITMQKYHIDENFPADWIKEWWKDSYRINGMSYGGGKWVVIMSQNTGISMQTYNHRNEYPGDWVKEKWTAGYEISNVCYGAGEWYVTMAQGTGITTQSYNLKTVYPRDWVQDKWDGRQTNTVAGNTNTVAPGTNGKIHLLMVANTYVSDIGTSCKVDEERVLNEFDIFARELDMPLVKHVINGSSFSKSSLEAELASLNPSANDIVVFVYSGHGFRWSDQTNKYPSISLKYSSYERASLSNSYLLADIYNKIIAKGARLNIIVGDCCNSPIGVSSRGGDFALSSRSGNNGNSDKLKKLFLNKKGNLILAAASPDETSCGNSRDGGYLISSFFQAIGKETSYLNNDDPDWGRIIQNAINSAKFSTQNLSGCSTQNGMYYSTVK
jgi:hypothetical protein